MNALKKHKAQFDDDLQSASFNQPYLYGLKNQNDFNRKIRRLTY